MRLHCGHGTAQPGPGTWPLTLAHHSLIFRQFYIVLHVVWLIPRCSYQLTAGLVCSTLHHCSTTHHTDCSIVQCLKQTWSSWASTGGWRSFISLNTMQFLVIIFIIPHLFYVSAFLLLKGMMNSECRTQIRSGYLLSEWKILNNLGSLQYYFMSSCSNLLNTVWQVKLCQQQDWWCMYNCIV